MTSARSPPYFAWRRCNANRAGVVSGGLLVLRIFKAVTAPLIARTGFEAQDLLTRALFFPSSEFWFGVDDLGRDFFTPIVYGARVSLTIGFAAAT